MTEITDQPKPLAGYSVQFATPCGDGKYDREFLTSFHNSACVLIECGAKIDFAEMPGCSDLGLARSKIFGNFLRSQHTHLMMVDSDMGWGYDDVVRLLLMKKDFVAGAGPKKTAKPEFACNIADVDGNPIPIVTDPETGLVEVSEVGGAFVLISKNCAQMMADAYPETAYNSIEGNTEYAVYDPYIVGSPDKRRRLSEDFAFCHRWREIGGVIYVLPDIHMTHAGRAVWEGSFVTTLIGASLSG